MEDRLALSQRPPSVPSLPIEVDYSWSDSICVLKDACLGFLRPSSGSYSGCELMRAEVIRHIQKTPAPPQSFPLLALTIFLSLSPQWFPALEKVVWVVVPCGWTHRRHLFSALWLVVSFWINHHPAYTPGLSSSRGGVVSVLALLKWLSGAWSTDFVLFCSVYGVFTVSKKQRLPVICLTLMPRLPTW